MRRLRLPKFGDVRSDGFRYLGTYPDYRTRAPYERWVSPEGWTSRRITSLVSTSRKRAKASALPFNLTAKYLKSIFPKDGLCPVLLTPMVWGEEDGRNSCPSLDRRVPDHGY